MVVSRTIAASFQSTAPVWGPTVDGDCRGALDIISIHGPRVGADLKFSLVLRHMTNFNPRPPCGGRHINSTPFCRMVGFQSTAPVWGPTRSPRGKRCGGVLIQSTAPVWGPTCLLVAAS